ncbi:hypothetical protein [Micromonospora sp. CPCC 206061]|uniref:hypothetical protein n=1 Tax=Micromonospora sp. CPCC 206061 TaxID=3122410 RepID=UPI002FF37B92
MSEQPPSTTPPPTSSAPAKPPTTPTDQRPKDILVGKVTRGGEGPCYGMVTDDGKEYALYSAAGTKLTEGDTVKIRYEPLRLKIYCGPGEHVSALEITVVK